MNWIALLGLARTYWKPLAVVLALAALAFSAIHYVHGLEAKAYQNGVTAERDRVAKQVAAENVHNRQVEQALQTKLDDYGKEIERQQQALTAAESPAREKLVDVLNHDPSQNCATNPEVTRIRNEIRSALK